jgi:hypothetical protein
MLAFRAEGFRVGFHAGFAGEVPEGFPFVSHQTKPSFMRV